MAFICGLRSSFVELWHRSEGKHLSYGDILLFVALFSLFFFPSKTRESGESAVETSGERGKGKIKESSMKALISVPFWLIYAQVVVAAVVVALFVHLYANEWQNSVNSERAAEHLSLFEETARMHVLRIRDKMLHQNQVQARLDHQSFYFKLLSQANALAASSSLPSSTCNDESSPCRHTRREWIRMFQTAAAKHLALDVTNDENGGEIYPWGDKFAAQLLLTRRAVPNASAPALLDSADSLIAVDVSLSGVRLANTSVEAEVADALLSFIREREHPAAGSGMSPSLAVARALWLSSMGGTFLFAGVPLKENWGHTRVINGDENCSRPQEYGLLTGAISVIPNSTTMRSGAGSDEDQLMLLTVHLHPFLPQLVLKPSSKSENSSSDAAACGGCRLSAPSWLESPYFPLAAAVRRSFIDAHDQSSLLPMHVTGGCGSSSAINISNILLDAATEDDLSLTNSSSQVAKEMRRMKSVSWLSAGSANTFFGLYKAGFDLSTSASDTITHDHLVFLVKSSGYSEDVHKLFTLVIVTWSVLISVSLLTLSVIRSFLISPLTTLASRMRNATRLKFSSSSKGGSRSTRYKRQCFMFTELEHLLLTYQALESSTRMFSKYVPREVVKDLMLVASGGDGKSSTHDDSFFGPSKKNLSSRESFSLFLRRQKQVEQRLITVLFADIANFTTFCEMVPTEDLVVLLDHYFSNMTTTLLQHGCTIDKFIGDAIMGFWGAPLDYTTQGFSCCCAALHLQKMVLLMLPVFNSVGFELIVRVGCHRGYAVVGNVGCSQRMSYTALGDTVNAASRLEGSNKMFGSRVIISAPVADDIYDVEKIFVLRELGVVKVKGKSEGISAFHLVGIAPDAVTYVRSLGHAAAAPAGYLFPPPTIVASDGRRAGDASMQAVPSLEVSQNGLQAELSGLGDSSLLYMDPVDPAVQAPRSQVALLLPLGNVENQGGAQDGDDRSGSSSDDDAESVFSGTAVRTHIRVVDGPDATGLRTAAPLLNGHAGNSKKGRGAPPGDPEGQRHNGASGGAANTTRVFEKVAKWSAEAELEQISNGFTITRSQQRYIAELNRATHYYNNADIQMAVALLRECLVEANDVYLDDLELPKEPLLEMLDRWVSLANAGVDPATFDPAIVLTNK